MEDTVEKLFNSNIKTDRKDLLTFTCDTLDSFYGLSLSSFEAAVVSVFMSASATKKRKWSGLFYVSISAICIMIHRLTQGIFSERALL